MSSPVDEDSSLDSLLSKYGTSKQSVKHAEMGEELSIEDYHQDDHNRELPSQFLNEIRERAKILSKNAVKSRKTALQNVVSDNLAPSTTGGSLDLFVDVIRSADILEDRVSSSLTSQTKDEEASELYSEDVLLQPVVPLDSVPWSMEDQDSSKTSSDYYEGLGLEPWGVPTTDILEKNDSEDSTSEESVQSENDARPPNHVLDQDDLLGDVDITPYAPRISTNHEENILNSGSYFDVRTQTKIAEEPQLVGNLDGECVTDDENIEDDTSSAISELEIPRRVIDRSDDLDVCFERLTPLASKTEEIRVKENKEESETYVRILDDETASGVPPQDAQFVSSVDSSSSNIDSETNVENFQLGENTYNRSNTLSSSLHPQLSDKAVTLSSDDGPTEDHQYEDQSCKDTVSFDIQVSPTPVHNQHLQAELDAETFLSGSKELDEKPTEVASLKQTDPQTFNTRVEGPVESSDHSFELLTRLESELDDRGEPVDDLLENNGVNEIAQSSKKTTDEQEPIDNDKGNIRKDANSKDISDKLKPITLFKVSNCTSGPQPSYKSNAKEFLHQKNVENQGDITQITDVSVESSELNPSKRQISPSSPPVENPKPNLGETDKLIDYSSPNHKANLETSGKSLVLSSSQEQQRISRDESRKEIKIHARKITENRTSVNTNNHDVRQRQLSIPKARLNVSQGINSPETQLSTEEPKTLRNVRSLIAMFSNSEKVNLSPVDSPRSPKVFNWNVSQPTRKHKTEETVFSFSSSRRDLEKRPPLSPDPVSSNDGLIDTQDVPWMRELKERRRRRQQGTVQAE